ncbi:MAG: YjbH domain-containing protein [Deltaproteobacteria bacterium]|nr:YjbH domain-containing protein [Deltaproteobacteria bacterium]
MEIPTARVLEDGVMRIGYAQADPYRWYTGGMGIFPGLEFSGRYTEMTNSRRS